MKISKNLVRLSLIGLIFFIYVNNAFSQDAFFKVNTLKFLDYKSRNVLNSTDIDGAWAIRDNRIRIDYGLRKLNSSVAELKILNSVEVGEKLIYECHDISTFEKVSVFIFTDPDKEEILILEIDLKSQKQYLQFSFQENEQVNKKTYFYNDLSPVLDYKIDVRLKKPIGTDRAKKSLTLAVYNKNGKLRFRLEDVVFQSFNDIYEFRTGSKITGIDNSEGIPGTREEFIVADFNFDGLEDFVIKRDVGGNQGSFYTYYIQNSNNTFTHNEYLTKKIGRFPNIDNKNKWLTLRTYYQQGRINKIEYHRYNRTAGVWEHFQTRFDEEKFKEINGVSARKPYMTESKFYKPSENSDEWRVVKIENKYWD